MIGIEVIPISTLLTLITTQVLEIAIAAKDVLVEKESFQKLSRYLHDIEPVLAELKERCFKDLTAANQALQSLKTDLDRAHTLISDCTDKSKFYLLLHCRSIVKDAQVVTRDIGKDLELLSLAGTELSLDIRDNLLRVKNQFLSAEFQASETKLQILSKLEEGIRDHRTDQGFANDLIVAIAMAVGVPVEPSEINKELSSFKREKELLAERKQMQEQAFMEQVIDLLSKADAAYTSDVLRQRYKEASEHIGITEPVDPLSSFICPLAREVMIDPVTASSNRTYERSEIERWFASGHTSDPFTHMELTDFTLRPNTSLRKAIQEWTDQNYCIRIRRAKHFLQKRDVALAQDALDDLCKLCEESNTNTEWIAAENVIPEIIEVMKLRDKEVNRRALTALRILVHNNFRNRDEVVQVGGLEQVVRCVGKSTLSKLALSVLLELLQGDERSACEKLCQEKRALLSLVMRHNENEPTAKRVLEKLCSSDENIVQLASMSYLDPLISSLHEGSEESKWAMARALGNLQSLSDQNKLMLGEKGVIGPLFQMMISAKLEAKAAALEALRNLSSNSQNQRSMAQAGAFPVLMDNLTSPRLPQTCKEAAAITLKNIAQGNTDASLTDQDGHAVNVKQAVETLIGLMESSSQGLILRAPILLVLHGLAQSKDGELVQEVIKEQQGVAFLVGLLDGAEREVRDSAVFLLRSMSEGAGGDIFDCLYTEKKLEHFVNLIGNCSSADIRSDLLMVLASFPSNKQTMETLMEAGAVTTVLAQVKGNSSKVTESALAALERFTEPTNVELQRTLVDSGIHSILVTILNSGTTTGKARAARALRNFSVTTLDLCHPPTSTGWLCFRPTVPTICRVHTGVCSVKTTFCIVEAKAVPGLVALLDEPSSVAAEAAVEAFFTFVSSEETREGGAWFLHEANAILKSLGLLAHGTATAKERTVDLLACLFKLKNMRETYCGRAKLPLVELAQHGSVTVKKKAGKVLAQLSMIQEVSSYF
ncbi:U-box domain-containing protein 44 [Selaginella moellendorffii]|uniref:U-box domain-containing protein 44 n=1 Tax=Selaginella moellendorffii TaxID=88036 RepID=UPI000D1C9360|nr:U-box domain-containing protein 44 [Selaginella moellendorffii]|eukprot:XP_024533623.1 U-box domain-containing protein 44 [Selaginella moellendorffii]